MNLADYERRKLELLEQMAVEKKRHHKAVAAIEAELNIAQRACDFILNWIDDGLVLHAEHVLEVWGNYARAGQDAAAMRDEAIAEILKGGGRLVEEYFGTKDYDRWHGQGVSCSYGFGPKHGNVIFSIGLVRIVREREVRPALNEAEINAAVYYLRNLEKIQACGVAR